MTRDRCLVVFTKPARPGRVKTRLLPVLTARQASELHQALLDDLLPRLEGGSFDLTIAWAVEPDEPLPSRPAVVGTVPAFRQQGEDLGGRLFAGLSRLARRYRYVAAVGSDHPGLALADVERAFDELEGGARIVLGPASDGGYYLVGLERERLDRSLFDGIVWSTERVLEDTLERCRRLGVEPLLLPTVADVDSPADLERLAGEITRGAGECPHVEALLRRWGRVA